MVARQNYEENEEMKHLTALNDVKMMRKSGGRTSRRSLPLNIITYLTNLPATLAGSGGTAKQWVQHDVSPPLMAVMLRGDYSLQSSFQTL